MLYTHGNVHAQQAAQTQATHRRSSSKLKTTDVLHMHSKPLTLAQGSWHNQHATIRQLAACKMNALCKEQHLYVRGTQSLHPAQCGRCMRPIPILPHHPITRTTRA